MIYHPPLTCPWCGMPNSWIPYTRNYSEILAGLNTDGRGSYPSYCAKCAKKLDLKVITPPRATSLD